MRNAVRSSVSLCLMALLGAGVVDTAEQRAVRAAAIAAAKAAAGESVDAVNAAEVFEGRFAQPQRYLLLKEHAAQRQFREAVAKAFGEAGRKYADQPVVHGPFNVPEQLQMGTITIDGGEAVLVEQSGSKPARSYKQHYRKVDGQWKWEDPGEPVKAGKDATAADALEARTDEIAFIKKLTRDVREGKYHSVEEADRAFRKVLSPETLATLEPGSADQPDAAAAAARSKPVGDISIPQDGDGVVIEGGGFGVGHSTTRPASQPAGESLTNEAITRFKPLMDQLTCENAMLAASGSLDVMHLSPAQQKQRAAADAAYDNEKRVMAEQHKAELEDIARVSQAAQAAGGQANPADIAAGLLPHDALFRSMVTMMRRHRQSLMSLLTPEQSQTWQMRVIRDALAAKSVSARTAGDDSRWQPTAKAALALPEPRGQSQVDALVEKELRGHWPARKPE